MIVINKIQVFAPEEGIIKTIDLNSKNTFTKCATCGIVSLYITAYGHMLKSRKSISMYSYFITSTKKMISNYVLRCSHDEADALNGLADAIAHLENNVFIHKDILNVKKISIFMDSYNDDVLSDFYVPFLNSINRSQDIGKSIVKVIYPYIDGDSLMLNLHEVPALFNNREIIPTIPFLNFVLSFNFLFDEKISIYTLIAFFGLFRINYLPDTKDNMGLGINTFTMFEVFGGRFINEKFDIDNFQLLHRDHFSNMLLNSNINLKTIEQSLEDETIQFFNINFKSLFNFDSNGNVSSEALDEEEEDVPEKTTEEEEPPKEEPPKDEPVEEEPENTEEPEDTENTDGDVEEEPPAEEAPKPEIQEPKPSPINFKLELGGEEETIDDLIYKKYAYNHIRNLLKQDIDTKVSSLMKIINNQWLFLLNTKTIKKLINNLEKIIANKGE